MCGKGWEAGWLALTGRMKSKQIFCKLLNNKFNSEKHVQSHASSLGRSVRSVCDEIFRLLEKCTQIIESHSYSIITLFFIIHNIFTKYKIYTKRMHGVTVVATVTTTTIKLVRRMS